MNTLQPETIHRQNKILAPIILAISIILLVVALWPLYSSAIEKSATLANLDSQYETKMTVRDGLMRIQEMFASGAKNDLIEKVQKLDIPYNVPDIMQAVMLNDYTRSTLSSPARITLGGISVSPGSKLPNGLSLGQVSVAVTGGDMYDVIDFITYLTTDSPYAFTIDSISLPIDTDPTRAYLNGSAFSLNLSLGMYYFE